MGCIRGITTIGGTIDLHMAAPTSLVAKIDGAVVVGVVSGSIVFTGVEDVLQDVLEGPCGQTGS